MELNFESFYREKYMSRVTEPRNGPSELETNERRWKTKREFFSFWLSAFHRYHCGRFLVYVCTSTGTGTHHMSAPTERMNKREREKERNIEREREKKWFWFLRWVRCLHVIMSFWTNLKFFFAMVSFFRFRSLSFTDRLCLCGFFGVVLPAIPFSLLLSPSLALVHSVACL